MRRSAVSISGKVFGSPNGPATLTEITRHEVGHCLGLGHANFDDLMDPYVGGANQISTRGVEGVLKAQHWALKENASSPYQSSLGSVNC